jgi:hypothetical protein
MIISGVRRRWKLLVTVATVLIATFVLGSPVAESSPLTRPTPGDLIVGTPITLPAALFDAGNPGSGSLITPNQAQMVATAMFTAWQSALATSDTRALTQLASPGPMLNGTIYNCAYPNGLCLVGPQTPPLLGLMQTTVPYQTSYPLYFMASIQTTNEVTTNSGLNEQEPWMDMEILTKASSAASWRLSFDSGYNAPGGTEPAYLPFDEATEVDSPGAGIYNAAPTAAPSVSATNFLPLLASYYQSFKLLGHAPANSVFVEGGQTSGEGMQLAQDRNDSTYNGSRDTYQFGWDSSAGSWRFTTTGGYPMECGSVVDKATVTALSGVLLQNSDETNYGISLAPGSYRKITTSAEHEVCVYVVSSGLAVGGGGQIYSSAVTGTRISSSVPRVRIPPSKADLETSFAVLANEMTQYAKQDQTCGSSSACIKSFALQAAQQFAQFDSNLAGLKFPARLDSYESSLDAATRKLNGLYEAIDHGASITANTAAILSSQQALLSEYERLVKAWS